MEKVIQLITFLNDAGAENVVKNYCHFIDKSKFEPIVVTIFDYCNDCHVYRSIQNDGVKIISVYDKNWHKSLFQQRIELYGQKDHSTVFGRAWNRFCADKVYNYFQIRFEKKTGRKLRKLFEGLKPDVIHAHLHVQNYLRWTKMGGDKCSIALYVPF